MPHTCTTHNISFLTRHIFHLKLMLRSAIQDKCTSTVTESICITFNCIKFSTVLTSDFFDILFIDLSEFLNCTFVNKECYVIQRHL